MGNKYISWRRVSTFKQGRSGLGLEAQKEIIRYFIERDKGKWIADYSECYTGTELCGCVELRKAMEHAKKENAILVIAKSDRFRNCQEALGILNEMGEGNIEFCDLPHSDRFTLTLFWALAEREALITSIRTKQALAAKRERGESTGGASERWRMAYEKKTWEQKHNEGMKKGMTKNLRHLESRDVQVFMKVLRNVFPDACTGDVTEWDWDKINTKADNRAKILGLMRDYKELEPTLFVKWDFDVDDILSRPLLTKLSSYIVALRKSVKASINFKNNE